MHRIFVLTLLLIAICGTSVPAQAQVTGPVQACQATCTESCSGIGDEKKHATCLSSCRNDCVNAPPPPLTVQPKYVLMTILYAPPGCTGGAATCGASSSSDSVDYGVGSSLGTKVSMAHSFKVGFSLTADAGTGTTGVGGGVSFTGSNSDSNSTTVTKSNTFDLKVTANGDGVDHGQDQFVLILNPTVTLSGKPPNVRWTLGHTGPATDLYTVYASELKDPKSMRPAVAAQFAALGFTTVDFNRILGFDPFAASIRTGGHGWYAGSTGTNVPVTGGGNGDLANDLRPPRFAPTSYTLPYEPSSQQQNCGTAACSCAVTGEAIKNDVLSDSLFGQEQDYNISIKTSVGVPEVWDFKSDTEMTWTTSATTDSTKDGSQTATVSIGCPSASYAGPTLMQVYWDSTFGSFIFQPIALDQKTLLQHGRIADSTGNPIAGKPVQLLVNGVTYHTYSGPNGNYSFYSLKANKTRIRSMQLMAGGKSQSVAVGSTSSLTLAR